MSINSSCRDAVRSWGRSVKVGLVFGASTRLFRYLRNFCTTHFFVRRVSGQPEKIQSMKQAASDLKLSLKRTRKRKFLAQMARVVPWAALITPYYPEGRTGRPPFVLETMLRVHFLQKWFSLSDPAREEAYL